MSQIDAIKSAHGHTKAAVEFLLGVTFDQMSPLAVLWKHITLAHADLDAELAKLPPRSGSCSRFSQDGVAAQGDNHV